MKAILTTYENMEAQNGVAQILSEQEIADYLNDKEENAAIIISETVIDGVNANTAVFRGAGGEEDSFFICDLPLEDPGDAEGGDWTAIEAIQEVTQG